MLLYDDLVSETERLLWERVMSGEPVDAPAGDREVRGQLVVELVTTQERASGERPHALRLRGAHVTGTADFEARTLVCPLTVEDSEFDAAIVLDEAIAPAVRLRRCTLPAVRARQLETRGDLDLGHVEAAVIDVVGARIGGILCLSDAELASEGGVAIAAERVEVHQELELDGVKARGTVNLVGAHIRGQLSFSGAEIVNPGGLAIAADGLVADQDVFCRSDFRAEGEIRLLGVEIGGELNFIDAVLKNPERTCVSLDTSHIRQNLFAEGLETDGEFRLMGARIDGQVDFTGAQLSSSGSAPALSADGVRIGTYLHCRAGFKATGQVDLLGAHIGAQLDFSDAHLESPDGEALKAYGLHVERDMFCRGEFTSEGQLRLHGARIGGQLDLSGATLGGASRVLHAESARIGENVVCGAGLTAHGEVNFFNAHISGQLAVDAATLLNEGALALDLEGARIDSSFVCRTPSRIAGGIDLFRTRVGGDVLLDGLQSDEDQSSPPMLRLESATAADLRLPVAPWQGQIDLTDARVGQLHDPAWPAPGTGDRPYTPRLSGFVYDSLGTESADLATRLDWIEHAEESYVPHAYDQLVTVLRSMGREEDARKAAIAKQRRRRTELAPHARAWSWFLDVTVGYGYRTWRAVYALLGVMLVGWIVFEWAWRHDRVRALKSSEQLPDFASWLYSIDAVLPVITLGQESAWAATGAAQYWYALSVLSGWVLGTALIAALTAMLNRQ